MSTQQIPLFRLVVVAFLLASAPSGAWAKKAFDTRGASTEELIHHLQDADEDARRDAIEEIEDRKLLVAADALAGVARADPSARVRRAALSALERVSVAHLVPAAETAVLEDMESNNREHAIALLAEHATPKSAGIVTQALESDPDRGVRLRAAKVLKKTRWPGTDAALLLVLLSGAETNLRVLCAEALLALDSPVHRKVVRDLALSDPNEDLRRELVDRITDRPRPEDRDSLLGWLESGDEDTARRAARGLGRLKDPSVIPAMEGARDGAPKKVREEIDEAIEDIEKR